MSRRRDHTAPAGDGALLPVDLPGIELSEMPPHVVDAVAGLVAGTMLPLLEQLLSARVAEMERRLQRTLRAALYPPLVDLAYLAWFSQTSEPTVRRRLAKIGIPKRNIGGMPWQDGDGPVRYSLAEWRKGHALPSNVITRAVNDQQEQLDLARPPRANAQVAPTAGPAPAPQRLRRRSEPAPTGRSEEEAEDLMALARAAVRPGRSKTKSQE